MGTNILCLVEEASEADENDEYLEDQLAIIGWIREQNGWTMVGQTITILVVVGVMMAWMEMVNGNAFVLLLTVLFVLHIQIVLGRVGGRFAWTSLVGVVVWHVVIH